MAMIWLWEQVSARVKRGMAELSPPLELLAPWEQVPLWAPFPPLELPHGDVGGNITLWYGAWKVGEGRVVVVGRKGFGWLRVKIFRPVVGAPPFVGHQYGHRGKPVTGVGENL